MLVSLEACSTIPSLYQTRSEERIDPSGASARIVSTVVEVVDVSPWTAFTDRSPRPSSRPSSPQAVTSRAITAIRAMRFNRILANGYGGKDNPATHLPNVSPATLPLVSSSLQLLGGSWPEEPGLDTALSKLILDRVSAGIMPATMRLYVPAREVAFGRRDAVTPQYPAAVAAAREAGFSAVERLPGGRAAVFTEDTIAFSLTVPEADPRTTIQRRFQEMSEIVVAMLSRLGVPSAIGEIPGEYCPGGFSVHHQHRIKLMGVGQRLAKRAAHVGGVLTVNGTELLLQALVPVYRALELEWRPSTVGTIGDIRPGVRNDDVLAALRDELAARFDVTRDRIDDSLAEEARSLSHRYLPVELG